ncbi:MAG: choice-of-anchor M domain-containing protein [Isosphaeraceae bacterium]
MTSRSLTAFAAVVLVAALAGTARAGFDNTYSAGHADLGVAYEDGVGLFLHYHFGTGAVINGVPLSSGAEYAPDEVTTIVSDANRMTPGSTIPFLGNGPSDPVWVLPASNVLGVPFLGIGTEELDPFDGWSAVTFALSGYSGTGNFALWQNNSVGVPQVKWRTNDGIGGSDSFTFPPGSHDHYFWGFTAPGIYDLTVTASASRSGTMYTDIGTFRFEVSSAVVPEPSGLVLAGIGLGAVLIAGWRRRGPRVAGARWAVARAFAD